MIFQTEFLNWWIFKKTNENITNLIYHEYIKRSVLFFSIKIFNLSQKLWSSNKIIILMIMIFLVYKMFFHWNVFGPIFFIIILQKQCGFKK
jgi:hypothetical protein